MGLSSGAVPTNKNTKLDSDAAYLMSEWVIAQHHLMIAQIHLKIAQIHLKIAQIHLNIAQIHLMSEWVILIQDWSQSKSPSQFKPN